MASFRTCYACGQIVESSSVCPCRKEKAKKDKEKRNEYMREYSEKNAEVVKPMKTRKWQDLRKQIIKRDKGYCQRCKVLFNKINVHKLEVHHIKPRITHPELMFDPDNLITVCSLCNKELGLQGLDFEPDKHSQEEITYLLF